MVELLNVIGQRVIARKRCPFLYKIRSDGINMSELLNVAIRKVKARGSAAQTSGKTQI